MANDRGVQILVLVQEFILSLVIILGGGLMLYAGKSTDVAITAITAVITFWFSRRLTEFQAAKQQLAQQQTAPPVPAQPVQPAQAVTQAIVTDLSQAVPAQAAPINNGQGLQP